MPAIAARVRARDDARVVRGLLLCCSLLGACAPPSLGARRAPILNGVLDPAHPAVGLLSAAGEPSCTATLVGARTLLTAAHCLSDEEKPPYTLLDALSIELGGTSHAAASATIHSSYSGWSLAGDVGVIRLAQPVPGITPALVATSAPAQGEAIVIVGFGCSNTGPGSSQTFGVKRKGETTISAVGASELSYPLGAALPSLCEGDSGGPSFASRGGVEQLVGVHSYDLDDASFDQRADAYRGWIESEAQGDLYQGPPAADAGAKKDMTADRRAQDLPPRDDQASSAADAGPPPADAATEGGDGGCSVTPGPAALSPLLLLLLIRRRQLR
jgi:hypothetical protein